MKYITQEHVFTQVKDIDLIVSTTVNLKSLFGIDYKNLEPNKFIAITDQKLKETIKSCTWLLDFNYLRGLSKKEIASSMLQLCEEIKRSNNLERNILNSSIKDLEMMLQYKRALTSFELPNIPKKEITIPNINGITAYQSIDPNKYLLTSANDIISMSDKIIEYLCSIVLNDRKEHGEDLPSFSIKEYKENGYYIIEFDFKKSESVISRIRKKIN